jgi:hypothetical protein
MANPNIASGSKVKKTVVSKNAFRAASSRSGEQTGHASAALGHTDTSHASASKENRLTDTP